MGPLSAYLLLWEKQPLGYQGVPAGVCDKVTRERKVRRGRSVRFMGDGR